MKILVVNFPYFGHTIPTLPIVEKLVKNGHKVTYINHEKWRNKITDLGVNFIPYDHYPDKPLIIDNGDFSAVKSMYDTTIRVVKNYDLIMYDFFFFLGNEIAKNVGIPAIKFCSQHAYSYNVLDEFTDNYPLWKLCKIPAIVHMITKLFTKEINTNIKDFSKAMMYDHPDLNIVFTCEDFQLYKEEFDKDKFIFMGSSANNDYVNSPEFMYKSNQFMKENNINLSRPLIYISMGTLMEGSYNFLRKCIKVLSNTDFEVIISAGREYEKLIQLNTSINIHIMNTVPQIEVLNYANLFITHGGMNSVNEAMFMGVPMFVLPISADQPTNAKLIQSYNLGLYDNINKISEQEILNKINYILNDNNIQQNIKIWKQKQIDAGGVNYAVEKIENYIKNIT